MSSDWDRKTEKPTEARRRLAREQGRVAVSRDLVAAFSLLWVLLAFHQFAGPFLERAVVSVRQMLQAAFSPQSLTAVDKRNKSSRHSSKRQSSGLCSAACPLISTDQRMQL